MAILKDVEVRIVSTSTNDPFLEYDDPKAKATGDTFLVEKYIEAETGKESRISIYIKPGFELLGAHAVNIGIKTSDGHVYFCKHYKKSMVLDGRDKGNPFIFKHVRYVEGNVGFAFGSLEIDEDIEIDKEAINKQADTIGSIVVYVERANKIECAEPELGFAAKFPPGNTGMKVAKELVKEKHCHTSTHIDRTGEKTVGTKTSRIKYSYPALGGSEGRRIQFVFRYRSHMHLQLLHVIPHTGPAIEGVLGHLDETEEPEEVFKLPIRPTTTSEAPEQPDNSNERDKIPECSVEELTRGELEAENRRLLEENATMKKEIVGLQDMKEKLSAFQTLMGSFNASATPIAKRERIKEEEHGQVPGVSSPSRGRPSKRVKIDLTENE